MERDAKAAAYWRGRRMTPLWKNIWQTKKVITTTELPDVFFFSGTFLQCSFFVGWRIFENIKWQIISLTFSKFWKFVPLRWCEAQLASLQPMIQEHKIPIGGSGQGSQNGWRWKSMKFKIRLLWMRKLGVFVSKTFWCWSLWFFGGCFLIPTHLMMCICW